MEVLVLEVERLVIVVDLGHVGIGENFGKQGPLATEPGLDLAVVFPAPAAIPALLVLPVLRVADAGLGLHVVEPGVFNAFTRGPDVLTGNRASVAADAFVEIEYLADLRADLHSAASLYWLFSARDLSFQSTSHILAIRPNQSRFEPKVR